MNRLVAYIAEKYRSLIHIHDTPHSIAGGVAIGVFIGFTPLFGLRMPLAFLIAWIFRCSKVAALVACNLHEIFFFGWGFVYIAEYKLGYWLLASPHRLPPRIPRPVRLADLIHEQYLRSHPIDWHFIVRVGRPWLVGSVLIGLPCAVASFFIALKLVREYQRKHQHLPANPAP